MVVYISGAITNNPYYLRQFDSAESKIINMLGRNRARVINPARLMMTLPKETPYECYMYISKQLIKVADMVVLLGGWEKSEGCKQELIVAKNEGVFITTLKEFIEGQCSNGRFDFRRNTGD